MIDRVVVSLRRMSAVKTLRNACAALFIAGAVHSVRGETAARSDAAIAAAPTLLIIHTPALAPTADAWAEYRTATGWNVVRRATPDSDNVPWRREQIRRTIREEAAAAGASPFAIMLLGDADDDAIPPWMRTQHDDSLRDWTFDAYATDLPYQFINDDQSPDVPLGRIPARTNAEGLAILAKIAQYEHEPALGTWRRRVTFVAGEGHYGPADALLEQMFSRMVDQLVPTMFDVSMTYMKPSSPYCPPAADITQTILDRLEDGALLFMFVGHGNADAFDDLYCLG
ncbi:MAG: hypothetical protein KC983_05795, partial [Phycisphaerales bacterium]|nr:hypothetical protein [Phycisphaerales bacterium]